MTMWKHRARTGFAFVLGIAVTSQAAALDTRPAQVDSAPQASQPADPPAASRPADAAEPAKTRKPPFTSRAWGTRRDSEPPHYVRTLSKTGIPGTESFDWLDLGLEHRTRWEYRDDDYLAPTLEDDNLFLLRSRGYLGIHDIIDPLRFGLEFYDARQFNSRFPEDNGQVDENEILQLFAELYFKDALGPGEPVRFQFGRMSFEYADRRLVGRNTWRNTVNSFDGFRFKIGEPDSDWAFDFFAVQPVERRLRQFSPGDDERWFYGLVSAWRRWSDRIIIEPYYFILDEDRVDPTRADRELHTMGVHAFGMIPGTNFDWDVDTACQFGDNGQNDHRAYAHYGEVGYTFDHPWKPRLSYSNAYATGDRATDDRVNERFDRLFGVGHPFSTLDYFSWNNLIMNKLRMEFVPAENIRVDLSYGAYLLARDSDAWVDADRRDPRGRSGDCVGQELEARVRWKIDPRIELELGYSHFMPGEFTKNTGPADDSDFFYVQTTFQLFE